MKTKLQKLQEERIQLIEEMKEIFAVLFGPNTKKRIKAQEKASELDDRINDLEILIKYYSRNTK